MAAYPNQNPYQQHVNTMLGTPGRSNPPQTPPPAYGTPGFVPGRGRAPGPTPIYGAPPTTPPQTSSPLGPQPSMPFTSGSGLVPGQMNSGGFYGLPTPSTGNSGGFVGLPTPSQGSGPTGTSGQLCPTCGKPM